MECAKVVRLLLWSAVVVAIEQSGGTVVAVRLWGHGGSCGGRGLLVDNVVHHIMLCSVI